MTKEMSSIFPLWTIYLYVALFQQHLQILLYLSPLIWYFRAYGWLSWFPWKVLLLTRKLLNQGFQVNTLKSSLRKFHGCHHVTCNCITNDHVYVPLVIIIIRSIFPHAWLITGFVRRVTRRMPQVEQELPIFSGVRVARSSVSCVMFYRSLLAR